MFSFINSKHTIHQLITLRFVAVLLQIATIIIATHLVNYPISLAPIMWVVVAELVINVSCVFYYRQRVSPTQFELFLQHIADLTFLSCLLFYSGGATNAFVSLLLIPIALAAVTLRTRWMILVTLLAVASYSLLLYLMPAHVMHHMDMQEHFIGMWVNFLFSAAVVSLVVGKMAREINKRERAIASMREEQLKQEQVISIAVASAQVTHQLATPIATVQLLTDELSEQLPNNDLIQDMQSQLLRCKKNIDDFRQLALDTKAQKLTAQDCNGLISQLREHISINFPNTDINWNNTNQPEQRVNVDVSLIPALLNLVQNGIRASEQNGNNRLDIKTRGIGNCWQLSLRDYGKGFTKQQLTELGANPVISDQGLGMAVFLSHASLNRLGATVTLTNHNEGGAIVSIALPLIKAKS